MRTTSTGCFSPHIKYRVFFSSYMTAKRRPGDLVSLSCDRHRLLNLPDRRRTMKRWQSVGRSVGPAFIGQLGGIKKKTKEKIKTFYIILTPQLENGTLNDITGAVPERWQLKTRCRIQGLKESSPSSFCTVVCANKNIKSDVYWTVHLVTAEE